MKIRWWILITAVAAVTLPAIVIVWPVVAGAITIAVLTATFVGIFWYAIDTRRLLEGQERAAELQRHPWLKATNLEPEFILPSDGEAAFGGFRIWLPITNMGHTPAFDLEITARIEVMNQGVEQVSLPEKRAGQTLIPRDVLHHEIGKVFLGGPDTSIRVYVEIVYRTIDGGRAHVRVGFVYAVRQGWHNLPTRYRFWLADGTPFPGRYLAEHSEKRGIVALKPETKEFPSP